MNPKPRQVTRENEKRAWELRQRCWTLVQIAAELKVDDSTVWRMLDRVERRLAEQLAESALPIKARQTAQLEAIAAEALLAWEKSKADAEKVTVVSGRVRSLNDEDQGASLMELPDQETRVVEGQSGNPALLAAAMKAMADVRAIWGLDAPQKSEGTLTVETKRYENVQVEDV